MMPHLTRDQVDAARSALAAGAGLPEALDAVSKDYVGIRDVMDIGGQIRHALAGAGPFLQPLLDDPAVTDVLVNGTKGIWIDRGRGLERVSDLDNIYDEARSVFIR